MDKFKQERDHVRLEFIKTMIQLSTAGFGVVAALAWNDAIQNLINRFVNAGSGLRSKFLYAFIVTILAVGVTYILGKIAQKTAKEE